MLITISGIDCSGKSTQIQLLEHFLHNSGRKVTAFWFRPGYSKEMDTIRHIIRQVFPGALPTAANRKTREIIFNRAGVGKTWLIMAMIDMFLQYSLKLRLMQRLQKAVICDRYLADAALDLALRFPNLRVREWPSFRLLEVLAPRPDVALLLVLPMHEVLRRMAIKNEPFPDTTAVREQRFVAYKSLAQSGNFTVIDATMSIKSVHAAILQCVSQYSH